ncbi:DUF1016 domain-containing protein [Hymenobacter tibetensis]|uniref:DUF1016 domain-containing protein n=1 Tax=Hymenobacter tibetensis TaxID=497967 RepID=UPI0021D40EE8|nr:DUF1016 domain-containing protein [Hymenobacter tibetensis]
MLEHVRAFLLELGKGFALVGSQYHLKVGAQDYYLDLVFYHLQLRCFVIIDLKIGEFKPEDSGKMIFYLAAADELLRHATPLTTQVSGWCCAKVKTGWWPNMHYVASANLLE